MNFKTILEDCKSRYKGFDQKVVQTRKPRDFVTSILQAKKYGLNPIISEIKPASPSGVLREINNVRELALEMTAGGACGVSVLTEEKYFQGALGNLKAVSEVSNIPVLRKDFIFDEAQIDESYYYGADSLLLISSFLKKDHLKKFIARARGYGMEPLVEIHSLRDVKKAKVAGAKVFVINNRDKDTLKIDLGKSKSLSKYIEGIKISASGIKNLDDLNFVLEYCDAALIGTSIMKADNILEKVKEFVRA